MNSRNDERAANGCWARSARKRRVYFDGERALIPLANAKGVAIVDVDDVALVGRFNWCLKSYGRVQANVAPRTNAEMHRFIMGHRDGFVVDHINGDPLDNRRRNLRYCTQAQNNMNNSGHRRSTRTSDYKGVHYRKATGRWLACIRTGGKLKHIGSYASELEAARAYNAAALARHGEYARLIGAR